MTTRPAVICWIPLCGLLMLAGCDAAMVGGPDEPGDTTPGGASYDPNHPSGGAGPGANNTNGGNNQGSQTNPGFKSCDKDADCVAPNVCNTAAGKCVPPQAKNNGPCDPIEGQDCPPGQVCLSGVCMTPPGGCVTNDECPAGYLCKSGTCVPDTKGQPGCKNNNNCPGGQICVNGKCTPKGACNIPHAKDRMKGNFKLDSKLKVRDGLKGLSKGVLSTATTLQNIINGNFGISGLPSFLSSMVGSLVQNLIHQYVPPWGKQVIKLLATIDDVIDDTRVVSIEHIQAKGNDMYTGWSTWQLVEFEFQGVKVSKPPQNIPGLGKVTTTSYTAREVCGVFFIDKHKVKNHIGKLYRWAIEALITGISCAMKNTPCYPGLYAMFNDLIKCPQLAQAVSSQLNNPGLHSLILGACQSQKQTFVKLLIKELDDLAAKLTYMSLKAKADIPNNNKLVNGRWYGTLGGGYGKGNFEGDFFGFRVP